MGWKLKQQQEKQGNADPVDVDCKHVKFFPKHENGVRTGFGLLGFIVLRVNVEHDKGGVCSVSWSDFSKGDGKFAFQYPSTMRRPFLKEQGGKIIRNKHGKEYEDLSLPEIEVRGEKIEFYSHKNLAEFLQALIGIRCTVQVLRAWSDRLEAIMTRKAEIAVEKGAKAERAAKKAAKLAKAA